MNKSSSLEYYWRPIEDLHGRLVGDPQILVRDPHIFSLETPRFSLETPHFRLRPPCYRWRSQNFHWRLHIFIGDSIFSLESPNIIV